MWWYIFPRFGGSSAPAADPGSGPSAFAAVAIDGEWVGAAVAVDEWASAEPVDSVGD
jgi:hypothetical protein